MKNLNLKYNVGFKRKQPCFTFYLSFPMVGISLFTISLIHTNSLLIHLFFFIVMIMLLFLCLYLSPLSPSKIRRLKIKLKKIIEINGFYHENKETKKIISSMKFKFWYDNNQLFIDVYPNGGKYSKSMNELNSVLETGLALSIESVQDDYPDHTTYIFSNSDNKQINVINKWS